MTQYTKIAKLLTRKCGATSMDIIRGAGTVSPHVRLHEMRMAGWTIIRKPIPGKTHGVYFGKAPV